MLYEGWGPCSCVCLCVCVSVCLLKGRRTRSKIIRGKIKLHVAECLVDFLVAVAGLAPNGLFGWLAIMRRAEVWREGWG